MTELFFLPSQTRPFMRANPLEQAVSEETDVFCMNNAQLWVKLILYVKFLWSEANLL